MTVDDRAFKNGGKQRMITHGGYVILLNVHSGVVHMDMGPLTVSKLSITGTNTITQTIITSNLDWNPSGTDACLPRSLNTL